MAQAIRMQSASGTATGRKTAVTSVSRPVARPFTAQRPVSSVARACQISRRSAVTTRAAAAPEAPSAQKSTEVKEFSALLCSSDWFFNEPQNESVAEQLRERVRFYKETGRDGDIYLVQEPKWLEAKFPQVAKQLKRPCVALVSTDKQWITFMKIRLDRVLRVEIAGTDKEVLAPGAEIPAEPKLKAKGWTAPYAPYTPGWWNAFVPKH